ncbi:hypothetical protein J6590_029648 [Homalodisca vitripennis]|nr:hypothetical protein J6590_029648 [Homalodisca vitripennis]
MPQLQVPYFKCLSLHRVICARLLEIYAKPKKGFNLNILLYWKAVLKHFATALPPLPCLITTATSRGGSNCQLMVGFLAEVEVAVYSMCSAGYLLPQQQLANDLRGLQNDWSPSRLFCRGDQIDDSHHCESAGDYTAFNIELTAALFASPQSLVDKWVCSLGPDFFVFFRLQTYATQRVKVWVACFVGKGRNGGKNGRFRD